MLHRANSDAGTRLRRAKSSASVHHRRTDPLETPIYPEHSVIAAARAYQGALKSSMPINKTGSVTRPKKLIKGAQGSHFQARRNESPQPSCARDKSHTRRAECHLREQDGRRADNHEGAKSIPKKIRQPTSGAVSEDTTYMSKTSEVSMPYTKVIRKTRSSHEPPLPSASRDDRQLQEQPSTLPWKDINVDRLVSRSEPEGNTKEEGCMIGLTTDAREEASCDIRERDVARDKHLEQFRKGSLRSQTSFMDAFRRRNRNHSPSNQPLPIYHNQSIPPFNTAHEVAVPPPAVTPAPSLPIRAVSSRQRSLSGSLRSRFKNLFHRDKRVDTVIPSQQVSAKQLYFTPDQDDQALGLEGPGAPTRAPPPPPFHRYPSASTTMQGQSECMRTATNGSQNDRSRITSWTDSTTVGTIPSRDGTGRLSSINQLPSRQRTHSSSARAPSAWLGAKNALTFRNKSRGGTKRSSEDSQRLYNALRLQIQGANQDPSELDMSYTTWIKHRAPTNFPDQEANSATLQPTPHPVISACPTIRSVSPDTPRSRLLPAAVQAGQTSVIADAGLPLQGPQLSRSVPERSLSPGEYRAQRYMKSQHRWHETLCDESPVTSRALRASENDNPYALGSIPTSPEPTYIPVALRHASPEHVKHCYVPSHVDGIPPRIAQVVSPSVYSQPADRKLDSPVSTTGTIVKITGREIQRYAVRPSSPERKRDVLREPSHD